MSDTQRHDDEDLDNNIPGNFSFGSPNLPGLAKITEEFAETLTIVGKLMMINGTSRYWGGRDLRSELLDEVADSLAAINVFTELNLSSDEIVAFGERVRRKEALFRAWHAKRSRRYEEEQLARLDWTEL